MFQLSTHIELTKMLFPFENGYVISTNMAARQPSLKTVSGLLTNECLGGFVQNKYTNITDSGIVSFRN